MTVGYDGANWKTNYKDNIYCHGCFEWNFPSSSISEAKNWSAPHNFHASVTSLNFNYISMCNFSINSKHVWSAFMTVILLILKTTVNSFRWSFVLDWISSELNILHMFTLNMTPIRLMMAETTDFHYAFYFILSLFFYRVNDWKPPKDALEYVSEVGLCGKVLSPRSAHILSGSFVTQQCFESCTNSCIVNLNQEHLEISMW